MRRFGSLLSWIWYSLLQIFHRSDPEIVSGLSLPVLYKQRVNHLIWNSCWQTWSLTCRELNHADVFLLLIFFVTHTHFNVLYITLSCLFFVHHWPIWENRLFKVIMFVNFMLIRGSPSFNDTPVWNILSPDNIGASTNRFKNLLMTGGFFIGGLQTGKWLRPYFWGGWYVRLGGRLTSHDSWLRWPSIMASSNRSCVVVDGQLVSDFVELSSEARANGWLNLF